MQIKSIPMEEGLDPVFARFGQKVYTYDYIEKLRDENLKLKTTGQKVYNLIPQKGLQEDVTMADADFIISGSVRGVGKVLPDDADIITPNGIIKNGELKVGDIISDPCTGKEETVLEIYEHKDHDFYELQFDDGVSVECGLEHLWQVRVSGRKKWRIMDMAHIIKWLDEQKEGRHIDRGTKLYLQIPLTEPVEFIRYEPSEIDTYILGAVIGDGCITKDITPSYACVFSNSESEVREQFEKAGVDMSHRKTDKRTGAYTYYIKDERLKKILTEEGLFGCKSAEKFIPERYKYARLQDRINLIQGLMDTDGYVCKGGKVTYSTTSPRLAADMKFLIESIGGTVNTCVKKAGYKKDGVYHPCHTCYELYIRTNDKDILFRLLRKKNRLKTYNGGVSLVSRRISGYKYIGKKNGRCISVSGEGKLYLTNHFIVTHNTWLALFIALSYINNPQAALYGFRKLEDDIKRSLWESSKHVFTGFGTPTESSYEWKFPSGAKFKMEQLYNARTVRERFRGAEQPYMMVEELQEHTVENMDLIFTLIGSNRNTVGLKNRFVATCNPVGKSNALRYFLDWYINPDTDTVIPERDGKKRYFFRYGTKRDEIAWGDSKEEVYNNINARRKIDRVCSKTGDAPLSLISSLIFIQGSFKDNKILQVSDKQYISKLMAQGDETSEKDVLGVWRDTDIDGGNLVSVRRIVDMFEAPSYNTNGFKRASADVALEGDFLVLMAFDGWHLVDIFAKSGIQSDTVVPIIKDFLKRNGVREDHFTYDSNGLGLWLKGHFKNAKPFNNKARSSEPEIYANLKTECAYKWAENAKNGKYTIESSLANMKFTKKGGIKFSLRDILIAESRAVRIKDDENNRYEIIQKIDMKKLVGHSPDFIECFFMVENVDMTKKVFSRSGFGAW